MDQKTLAGAANLAGVIHTSPDEFVYCQIHIAVIQYYERIVAAEFQCGVCQIFCCDLRSSDTDFCAAGQCYQMNSWIGYSSILYSSRSRQALDRSIRHAGFYQHFCQTHQSQRVIRRRKYDSCVTHHQSRSNFLIVQIAWEVERDDACNYADRLSCYHLDMIFLSGFCAWRNDGSVVVFSMFCKGSEGDLDVAYFSTGFCDRFAVFCAKGLCQGFLVEFYDINELVEDICTFCNREFFPFLLSFYCCGHSFFNIFCCSLWNVVNNYTCCRGDDVKGFLAYAVYFFTVYDHFHMYSSPILILSICIFQTTPLICRMP